jgi:succinate-semialdehyde dehydrogenase / glutarate-semialdehyde dehydrogenase
MGSLASEAQLHRVAQHVDDAAAKGARILAGGRARPDLGPCFYEPTLLAGVDETMDVCRAETFGPVCSIYPCSSPDDMVRRANDSEYGLNASVWTRDTRRGRALAARLQAGTVNVNEAYAAAFASAAPQGGFKQSGMGRRHARQGIIKYTEAQTVAVERLLAIDTPPWLTHAQYAALMPQVLRVLRRVPWFD